MPPISDAMVRSLQAGLLETLTRRFTVNDVTSSVSSASNSVTDFKTAFSSWDNCMQASFCKWPVIAAIIVGGLIVFSVVWCIIRCACCGLSCCCECCHCLKCCGSCCGCCDPPGGSRGDRTNGNKYLEDPYIPPNQGYTAPAPMSTGALGSAPTRQPTFPSATSKAPPQYAEFEVSKKGSGGDDALPEMPSWETSTSQKVLVEDEEGVELSAIKKSPTGGLGQNANAGAAVMSGSISPVSPRGQGLPGQQQGSGYGMGNGEYGVKQDYGNGGYSDRASPYGQGQDQYALGGSMGPGRRSPGQQGGYNNNGYGQQDPYNQHGNNPAELGFQRTTSPQGYSQQGYRHQNSPSPMGGMSRQNTGGYPGPRRSPAPQQDPYGQHDVYGQQDSYGHQGGYGGDNGYGVQQQSYSPNPQHQYSSDSSRPLAPGRGYTASPAPLGPPTGNTGSAGGFDFSSGGYSRPQDSTSPLMGQGGFDRRPSPSPPQQGIQRKDTYPGYKPFNPGH